MAQEQEYIYIETGVGVSALPTAEAIQKTCKENCFTAFESQYPDEKCETKIAYQDRITGNIEDTVVKLTVGGQRIQADRLSNPHHHPTDINKIIIGYNKSEIDNILNGAYYLSRVVGVTKIDRTTAESPSYGFKFNEE